MFTGTNAIAGNSPIYTDGTNLFLGGMTGYAGIFNRTSADNYIQNSVVNIVKHTTADMVDGFGPRLTFSVEDSSLVEYPLASIGATRNGADNTGKLNFMVSSGGSVANKMTIGWDGTVSIPGVVYTSSYLQMAGIGTPAAPPANALCVYSKLGQLWYRNATGDYYVGGGTSAAGGGDFYGVASSTTDDIITFANTGGKTAKDSGKKLSDLVYKDGSTTMTGDLAFGGNKGTGAANGTAAGELVTYPQLANKLAKIAVTVGPASDDVAYDYETDGTADDATIELACNSIHDANRGGVVYVMPGNYHMAASSAKITVPPWVELRGINEPGQFNASHVPDLTHSEVARFFITATDDEAVELLDSGSGIYNIEFLYPDQHTSTAPVVYPATVELSAGGMYQHVEYCSFVNSYIAINQTAGACKSTIQHNTGYPIYIGYQVANSYDINLVNDNHWNPHSAYALGYCPVGGLSTWIMANAIGFKIGRSDGIRITNNFCYYYAYGIILGANSRPIITGNYLDFCKVSGILIDGDVDKALITGNVIHADGNNAVGIRVDADVTFIHSIISENEIESFHGDCMDLWPTYPDVVTANVVNSNDLQFGDNSATRYGIRLAGHANTMNGNVLLGTSLQTVGIIFAGLGNVVNDNSVGYTDGAAVSADVSATQYVCLGNSGFHTAGFPSDANTATVKCGYNSNVAY
jgi:hypothetical protein